MVWYFVICGSLTIWLLYDFFFAHKYFDGPRAAAKGFKKAILSPIYYFFGYQCDCGKQFLSSKEAQDHMKNCPVFQTHDYLRKNGGWWPKF